MNPRLTTSEWLWLSVGLGLAILAAVAACQSAFWNAPVPTQAELYRAHQRAER